MMNEKKYMMNDDIWLLKQAACFEALNIANGILSNYEFPNIKKGDMVPGTKPTEEEVRMCFNKLVVSCSKSDVSECLKKILGFYGPVSFNDLVDLIIAVRKELGFKNLKVDKDTVFIGKVGS